VNGAAIVQGDRSVLLEVAHPGFEQARGALAAFAELEKSPEHVHTYRISAVSLWNAAAAGLGAAEIAETLVTLSRYEVPQAVLADVRDLCARYGRLRLLEADAGLLRLVADAPALLAEVARAAPVAELLRGGVVGDRGDAGAGCPGTAQAGADRARVAGRGPRPLRGRRRVGGRACR
jgi:DNA excision repair protein ERCC-3